MKASRYSWLDVMVYGMTATLITIHKTPSTPMDSTHLCPSISTNMHLLFWKYEKQRHSGDWGNIIHNGIHISVPIQLSFSSEPFAQMWTFKQFWSQLVEYSRNILSTSSHFIALCLHHVLQSFMHSHVIMKQNFITLKSTFQDFISIHCA